MSPLVNHDPLDIRRNIVIFKSLKYKSKKIDYETNLYDIYYLEEFYVSDVYACVYVFLCECWKKKSTRPVISRLVFSSQWIILVI